MPKKGCHCLPPGHGWYWATRKEQRAGKNRQVIIPARRGIVWVGLNGNRHLRVWEARASSSQGLEDFEDYRGPLEEGI